MIIEPNQLTDEKRKLLKQGTKVEFKWHGSNEIYKGRIEVSKYGELFFCSEHNYEGDVLTESGKAMQYYNSLNSFFHFSHFEII